MFKAYLRDRGQRHPEDVWEYQAPKEALYILDWFWDLNLGRSASAGGYLGLSAQEIVAWCSLRRLTLKAWELDALRRLDATFLRVMSEKD